MWQISEFASFDDIKELVFGNFEAAIANLPRSGKSDLKLAARISYNIATELVGLSDVKELGKRQRWLDEQHRKRDVDSSKLPQAVTYAYCRRHVPNVAVPHLTRFFGAEWARFAPGKNFPRDSIKLVDRGYDAKNLLSGRHKGRLISDYDPIDLGVHRSITTENNPPYSSATLPEYVTRAHDAELHQLLNGLHGATMVLLVGRSSTGKTRAAYEAVLRCLPDWPMLQPTDTAELIDLLTTGIAPRRLMQNPNFSNQRLVRDHCPESWRHAA